MAEGPAAPRDPCDGSLEAGAVVIRETADTEYKSLADLEKEKGFEKLRGKPIDQITRKLGTDGWKKVINAMVNSNGGKIHFGINDQCVVEEGVALTEKHQEIVEIRVHQIVSEFCPSVEPERIKVHFIPMSSGKFRFTVVVGPSGDVGDIVFMKRDVTLAYRRRGADCSHMTVDEIKRCESDKLQFQDDYYWSFICTAGSSRNTTVPIEQNAGTNGNSGLRQPGMQIGT